MTTAEIGGFANRGNVARDMDLATVLKYQVIPEFLQDVRVAAWRKRYMTVTTSAGVRAYSMTAAFAEMREVWREGYGPLEYIGADEQKVLKAESAAAQEAPSAYYIGQSPSSSTSAHQFLVLSAPPDGVYSLRCCYLFRIPWGELASVVDLAPYIPEEYHWGLVEGVKREIYEDRFGLDDPRTVKAARAFEEWKQRALVNPELSKHGSFIVTV